MQRPSIEFTADIPESAQGIVNAEALELLGYLQQQFNGRRLALLDARRERQQALDNGHFPDFLPDTADIRAGDWKVAPVPASGLCSRITSCLP